MLRWLLAEGSFSTAGGMSIRLWTNCRNAEARAMALTPRVNPTIDRLNRT
jgi:hypothetical protein